jgi:hypothetical protein
LIQRKPLQVAACRVALAGQGFDLA